MAQSEIYKAHKNRDIRDAQRRSWPSLHLPQDELTIPRGPRTRTIVFPKKLRRYLRRLWESRGGGFYGLVAALTFLYLEAVSLIGDFARVGRWEWFDLGWWIQWAVSNLVEAALNTVWAALWPLTWMQHFGIGLLSGGLLAGTYLTYRAVRPSVLRLLRDPGEDPPLQPTAGTDPGGERE